MLKAMREAKVTTSWIAPNAAHEKSVAEFIHRILTAGDTDPFLTDFRLFQRRIAHLGLLNSLSQTVLKLTCPGVPDTYQGTELWDFSLVDPDNRRPVDFPRRRRIIEGLHAMQSSHRDNLAALASDLLHTKEDGRLKFYITWQLLKARRDHPGLFTRGQYVPLDTILGPQSNHLFAFARTHQHHTAIVIVPRLLATLVTNDDLPLGPSIWPDTAILLPQQLAALRFRNLFTGLTIDRLDLRDLFAHLPVAVLLA